MGECKKCTVVPSTRVAVDSFAGRIQVEWDPDAAVTPFGQLPFFIQFLKVSGLYEAFIADCPLQYLKKFLTDVSIVPFMSPFLR
jgi:hypothetical protein